jgi:Photosynthesis affected mutant 68
VASATALPAAVSDRILRRVLVCASPGAVLGLLSGPASYLLLQKEKAANVAAGVDVETFNPALLYSAGSVLFFLSAVGISYGILSASWDGAPGSLLGWAEAKNNVAALRERFGWTKKD